MTLALAVYYVARLACVVGVSTACYVWGFNAGRASAPNTDKPTGAPSRDEDSTL